MNEAPAYVDFETRSRADLKKLGGRRYAEHPSTEAICAVLRTPEGEIVELDGWDFEHDNSPPEWPVVVAHNAINFDRHIWAKLGWPEPKRWVDTAELAKVAGYPSASLEALAELLLGVGKDMAGNELTLSLSQPAQYYGAQLDVLLEQAKLDWRAANPKGCGLRLPTPALKKAIVARLDAAPAFDPAPIPADVLARVTAYCRSDVEIMVDLAEGYLLRWLDSDLPGLEAADRALNGRGVCFDQDLARLLLDADAALSAQALERAGLTAAVEVSPARLQARLAQLGVRVDNCQADTLEATARGRDEHDPVRLLIEARQASSSIAAGKLLAGLARVSADSRLRDNRTYMGAHTGRWAGRGFQMDNMAKGI